MMTNSVLKCSWCNSKFNNAADLRLHVRKLHDANWQPDNDENSTEEDVMEVTVSQDIEEEEDEEVEEFELIGLEDVIKTEPLDNDMIEEISFFV